MMTRRLMMAALAASVPAKGRAQFVPQKTTLSILSGTSPTHRMDVRDGGGYRIFRAVPHGRADHAIYLLDGNGAFDVLTQDLLAACPRLAIFGIGYPTDYKFDTDRRSLDYTPPVAAGPTPAPQRPSRMIGGAGLFLPRLTGELRRIAEEGSTILTRTLWGHSFGGLFALHALFTKPESFDRYAAISPSLWWGDGMLITVARMSLDRTTPLLIACGDAEARRGDLDDDAFRHRLAVEAAQRQEFFDTLRETPRLELEERVFPGLGHGQTLAASLPFALEMAE